MIGTRTISLRAALVVFAATVLAACSGGGGAQQVAPASGVAPTAPVQSAARTTGTRSEDRGGGGGDAGDSDDNGGKIVYNSVPKVLKPIASLGFECCTVKEFGDGLKLTHTGRLQSVAVVMDSWGCQTGRWNNDTCVSAPNASFTHPVTVNVYAANTSGPAPAVGALLASRTQTFTMPYRPSADNVRCTGTFLGEYYSAAGHTCANGVPFLISFDLSSAHANLPKNVIVSVAYNTSTQGYHPIGTSTACFTSSGGCAYDSLNVGADGNGGPVGSVLDPNGVFVYYGNTAFYCDPSQGSSFRLDTSPTPCGWAGFHPQITVSVADGRSDGGDRDNRD